MATTLIEDQADIRDFPRWQIRLMEKPSKKWDGIDVDALKKLAEDAITDAPSCKEHQTDSKQKER